MNSVVYVSMCSVVKSSAVSGRRTHGALRLVQLYGMNFVTRGIMCKAVNREALYETERQV
jgi:hypothetical protein